MADLPQQMTIVQYVADGVTTTYIVPFFTPIETDGTPDLDVYTQAPSAPPVPSSDINEPNVAYTYTPNLDPITGGIITFQLGFVPATGFIVTIVRDVSASLDVEFSNAQNFSGITLDAALDKLLLISQQNKTYAFQRNLSYIVNTYLPESTIEQNVSIPVLGENQVWMGTAGGVAAVTLAQGSDVSTLRSQLANNAPVTNGAALVGYYDTVNNNPTTVASQLTLLTESVVAPFPTGSIIDFAAASAPAGFLVCNGSAVSRTTYADLFAVIGTTWGIGDGATTFNLPNLKGNVTAGSGGTLFSGSDTVGLSGGSATHVMQASELVGHAHGLAGQTGTSILSSTGGASSLLTTAGGLNTTLTEGTNPPSPFTIVQPTAIVLKIIKT